MISSSQDGFLYNIQELNDIIKKGEEDQKIGLISVPGFVSFGIKKIVTARISIGLTLVKMKN